MFSAIKNYFARLSDFEEIPAERRASLQKLAAWISEKRAAGQPIRLTFICTHNSRRSHFGQVWAAVAAEFYDIKNVESFSGGTEATACNLRTLAALERAGFDIERAVEDEKIDFKLPENVAENPYWKIRFSKNEPPILAFSKIFDAPPNPVSGFAAIMTCSHAEENCPFVPGCERRFSIPYDDPKMADDSPDEAAVYDARCRQIAQEMAFVFSEIL